VMVSHTVVDAYDAKNPASLSKAVHNVLRKTMGFSGVIVTAGLEMSGVTKFIKDPAKAAILAVQAGNDLLCTGTPVEQYEAILKAVKDGTISEERINESVLRILEMKKSVGFFEKEEKTEKQAEETEAK
ncbi:MAG: glycoside hydrolase family 3 protein, partial [Clostridia bacterium]|nr:glycoside hydrolase family 3 protein [Clostridia bacterium]